MKKFLLVVLLLITHLFMSYNGSLLPWRAVVGSVLIAVIAHAAWPSDWKDRLGLRIPARDALLSIALAPILMFLLYWAIRFIVSPQNIVFQPSLSLSGVLDLGTLHTLGQTLNEELLFGALLLTALCKKYPKSHPLLLAGSVALVFSLLHYVFYRWIVLPGYGGSLTASALFVLLAIGLLRNTLILKAGHIAYSWSLHFSINLVGLTALYTFENGVELTEPQIFNRILGAPGVVFFSAAVLAAGACWLCTTSGKTCSGAENMNRSIGSKS